MTDAGTPKELPVIATLNDKGVHAFVELVMSQCKECPKFGPWTMTVRNSNGRCTEHDMWDVEHNKETGHKSFYQFKLTRSNARIV